MVKEKEKRSSKVRYEPVNGSVDIESANEDGKEQPGAAAASPNGLQSAAAINAPETSDNAQSNKERKFLEIMSSREKQACADPIYVDNSLDESPSKYADYELPADVATIDTCAPPDFMARSSDKRPSKNDKYEFPPIVAKRKKCAPPSYMVRSSDKRPIKNDKCKPVAVKKCAPPNYMVRSLDERPSKKDKYEVKPVVVKKCAPPNYMVRSLDESPSKKDKYEGSCEISAGVKKCAPPNYMVGSSDERPSKNDKYEKLAGKDTKETTKETSNDRKILRRLLQNNDAKRLMRKAFSAKVINETEQDHHLPLHFGIHFNAWACIKVLCEGLADINVEDSEGRSTLHHIAETNEMSEKSEEGAWYCIEHGAKVDAITKQECTPLHYAAANGNIKMINILCAAGANKLAKDKFGNNVLHHSVRGGNLDVVRDMLKYDEVLPCLLQANAEDHTPLHEAVCQDKVTMVTTMLGNIPDPEDKQKAVNKVDKWGKTPLMLAAERQGNRDIIEELLKSGADIDYQAPDGSTILHLAAACAKQDSKHLIERAVGQSKYQDFINHHFQAKSTTPLHVAARNNNVGFIGSLIDNIEAENIPAVLKYVDGKGDVPFLTAVRNGAEEAAIALLELGTDHADVFVTDENLQTALHIAMLNEHWDLVEMFLLRSKEGEFLPSIGIGDKPKERMPVNIQGVGALKKDYLRRMVNAQTNWNFTPLHYSVTTASEKYAKILLDEHADISIKTKTGMSSFFYAVKEGQFGIFKLLFDEMEKQGFDPLHNQDNHNNTAAHKAAKYDRLDIVKYLVERGEDVLFKRNNEGKTPLQFAISHGSLNTVKYLLEHAPYDTLDMRPSLCEAINQGHHETVGFLLQKLSLQKLPQDKMVPHEWLMEESLNARDRKMVQLVLQSKHWKMDLKETNIYSRMIRSMADESRMVMDKCLDIKVNDTGKSPDIETHKQLTVDFSIFEWKREEGPSHISAQSEHPVKTIIDSADETLICHPTFLSYISEKWKSTRVFYWIGWSCMLAFAVLVSANVTLRTKPATIRNIPPPTQSISVTPIDDNETDTFRCDWLDPPRHYFVAVTSIIILVAACLGLVVEILQMKTSKGAYISQIGNWFDLSMYVFCLMVTVRLRRCYEPTDWQWDLAPFAVLITWFNVLFSMKGVPICGLYICMVSDILTSFLRFLGVFALFVLAFALSFSILLHDLPPFQSVFHAFPTMWVMATGELGYTDLFHAGELGQESPLGHQAAAGFCLLLIFVSMMTIIIANLMIGLAVEDVSQLRQQAKVQMVKIRAELFLEMEYLNLPVRVMKKLRNRIRGNTTTTKTYKTYKILDCSKFGNHHPIAKILNGKEDLMDQDYIIQRAREVVQGNSTRKRSSDSPIKNNLEGRETYRTRENISTQLHRQQQQLQSLKELIEERLPPKGTRKHTVGRRRSRTGERGVRPTPGSLRLQRTKSNSGSSNSSSSSSISNSNSNSNNSSSSSSSSSNSSSGNRGTFVPIEAEKEMK